MDQSSYPGARSFTGLGVITSPMRHGSTKFELRGPPSGVKTAAELKTAMGL